MSDNIPQLLQQIRDALGMDADEKLVVSTPQFERGDEVTPSEPPLTYHAVNRLKRANKDELVELGLRKWSDETGLWLLPHEWHPHLPEDYTFLSINEKKVTRGDYPANPDKRFGVLSFGIVPEFEQGGSQ